MKILKSNIDDSALLIYSIYFNRDFGLVFSNLCKSRLFLINYFFGSSFLRSQNITNNAVWINRVTTTENQISDH